MKNYRKEYPRPQFVRESFLNLNGEWDFAFDDKNVGLSQKWGGGIPAEMKIKVPFSYETKLSGIADTTVHMVVWYQRTAEFSYADEQRVWLWFEGCDYHMSLWVNDIHVGEHTGGYTRFGFDITDALNGKNAKIVVRAEDPLTPETARGKQRWQNENFGCWYLQTTGIWKTVWSETVSTSALQHVKITPDYDNRRVSIDYTIVGAAEGLEIETWITYEGKTVCRDRMAICESGFSRSYDLQKGDLIWEIAEWAPQSPNLYEVEFCIYKENTPVDKVESYFGLRKISIDSGVIRLNNNPLYQKLVLDQGYWEESGITPPSEEAIIKDIDLMLAMGFNGVRKHQKIEDERFLYWCDVKGLLVWSEMPATYKYTDHAAKQFVVEWQDIIRQNYNHPCIITWVPFNESWGVPNIASQKDQQTFTETVYYLTKAYDRNRPVICNDGWEHTISDIITLHDYDHDGESMLHRYGRDITPVLENRISHGRYKYAFADGYSYKGQPIIISEYGGVAYSDTDGWGYNDKAKTSDELCLRTSELTSAIRQMPAVSGYCITQLTDVEQEVNGLLYVDRNPKADIEKYHEIFSK